MVADTLRVQMLGEFTLQYGCQEISDNDNRSRKVWLLLAYMIYCRNRSVSQEDLVNLLWGEEERSSNPLNALKTMFHRVRTMLNQLDASAGHTLIIRRDGSYAWNPDVEFFFDVEEFEALCRREPPPQRKMSVWKTICRRWISTREIFSQNSPLSLGWSPFPRISTISTPRPFWRRSPCWRPRTG